MDLGLESCNCSSHKLKVQEDNWMSDDEDGLGSCFQSQSQNFWVKKIIFINFDSYMVMK